jgi:hypothetical protein
MYMYMYVVVLTIVQLANVYLTDKTVYQLGLSEGMYMYVQ